MPKISQNLTIAILCTSVLNSAAFALPLKAKLLADAPNFYISYYSPADVATQVGYQASQGIHSTII